ncbi:MAG: RagB/SusD family nutrient uptake outer membrane protein [Mediterranea sp.]|nr:RagB/SusD family nutrient uptake outer membrane protein [Mediterranea sp.]
MKENIKILALALCSALCVSCDDLLDAPTKSTMDESVIFSTPAYAKNAIAGIIHSMGETNSYRGRYFTHYGLNTDVEVRNLGAALVDAETDNERLANYTPNPSNSNMNTGNDTYIKNYEGIERANLAIRGLRAFADLTNWELRQILGELLTIRAVLYVDLLKAWGNVPARFEPINSENIYLPRADRDEILKQLLADLEEAAGMVGWPNENSYTVTNEHINKAFVKGLRSRVALMAGGYSLHVGESALRLSNDPDLAPDKMYQIVKDECLEVIGSGMARLQPKGDYSSSYEAWIRAIHSEKHVAGDEALWEIPFSTERGRVIYTWGINHTNADKFTQQTSGGNIRPNPVLYYKYNRNDVRRNLTCVPYQWTSDAAGADATPRQVITNLNDWRFGKHRFEWLSRRVTNTNDDGLNFLYMRYSNVLLMAAEAINELDGPGNAAPYLKEVKDRAYPDNPEIVTTEMSQATASKEAFFKAIVDERAKELAGEMYRKEDLIRWNMLKDKLDENIADLQKLHNRETPYNNVNAKVYWKTGPETADGTTLIFYGLEPGETETAPGPGYTEVSWNLTSDTDARKYWERIYAADPNLRPYWPVWQNILDASNGKIVNDPIFQ